MPIKTERELKKLLTPQKTLTLDAIYQKTPTFRIDTKTGRKLFNTYREAIYRTLVQRLPQPILETYRGRMEFLDLNELRQIFKTAQRYVPAYETENILIEKLRDLELEIARKPRVVRPVTYREAVRLPLAPRTREIAFFKQIASGIISDMEKTGAIRPQILGEYADEYTIRLLTEETQKHLTPRGILKNKPALQTKIADILRRRQIIGPLGQLTPLKSEGRILPGLMAVFPTAMLQIMLSPQELEAPTLPREYFLEQMKYGMPLPQKFIEGPIPTPETYKIERRPRTFTIQQLLR